MTISPLAGKPATPDMLIDVARLEGAYYTEFPDPAVPARRRHLRHLRAPRLRPPAQLQRGLTSWPSPRPSASTAPGRASPDRCSWASTPTPSPSRPTAARSRCWRRTASRPWRRPPGLHPHPRRLLRHPRRQSGRPAGASLRGPADGIVITPSHNPPPGRGLQVQPAARGPGGHGRDPLDRGPGQRPARRRTARRASPLSSARRGRRRRTPSTPGGVRFRPGAGARPGGDQGLGAQAWASTPSAARACTTGGLIARALRAGPDRGQRRRRPHVPLYDPGLGRQDPDGLLLALRHGPPGRPARSLRRRFRLRHGSRPARHRDPRRGAAGAERLPGGVHRLPVREPPGVGRGRGGGQDGGQQQHHRSGRRSTWGAGCTRCRWASSGSSPASTTAPSASAAKRARAPPSCAGTGRCGRRTRTGSPPVCSPRR